MNKYTVEPMGKMAFLMSSRELISKKNHCVILMDFVVSVVFVSFLNFVNTHFIPNYDLVILYFLLKSLSKVG